MPLVPHSKGNASPNEISHTPMHPRGANAPVWIQLWFAVAIAWGKESKGDAR